MPDLQIIRGDATPEEVAAIVAAVGELQRRHAMTGGSAALDPQRVSHWTHSARLVNRRAGMERGPWRLSGRLSRRSRA